VFYGVRHTFEPPDGVPRGRRHYENLVLQIEEMIEGADLLKSLPSCLIVTPSMRCNNRCRMCEVHTQAHGFEELPDTLYQSIRELLPALRNLSFGGAEPLMASRFPALLRECDADLHPDLELTVTTNGLLLTPAMLADMARPRFNTIIVSLNAATPEAYDVISGTTGRFPRVVANIRALVEAARGWRWQPDIQLSHVVTSSTWRETAAFIALARSLGTAFRLLPVEYDRLGESIFTDLDTMRAVLAHFERDVRPLVADLPPVLRAQATMMEARLRERIEAGRTGAL
jgi:MoaA/NifB/PqqE/SkfB family radical SAM enzyme